MTRRIKNYLHILIMLVPLWKGESKGHTKKKATAKFIINDLQNLMKSLRNINFSYPKAGLFNSTF